jgi:tetratricopeptide (TPR) repeat protein
MADKPEKPGREPIPPAKRRMLQQCFEHGSKSSAQGQFDYADQMFSQCVVGDPSNPIYVGNLIGNLHKKYNNNKSGAKLASMRGATSKAAVKNAARKKDWTAVITSGLEMLKLNPWDASTLGDMAQACQELGYDECQVIYLSSAVDADVRDPETNRLLARALGRQGEYDKAIGCWTRVLQAKPNDEEAQKQIPALTTEKTIEKGGYETAESSTEVMADKQAQAERQGSAGPRAAPEQQIERKIAKDPGNMSLYLELADLHLKEEKFDEAEKVFERALQASGGSIDMRERLEDVQLQRARKQVVIAEKRAMTEKSDEAVKLAQQMKSELNSKELEVYRARCDRYPNNLAYRTELGLRLFKAKNFQEAIKVFQEARGDSKQIGRAHV